MKKSKIYKKNYLWIVIFILPFFVILALGFMLTLHRGSLLTLSQKINTSTESQNDVSLLKGKKIQGLFVSPDDNLGSIAIPFETFGRISTDKLIFRLKEQKEKKWYYENVYAASLLPDKQFFPFGFPPISISKGKTYEFEVESNGGTKNNAISLQKENSQIITIHHFDKSYLLQHKSTFLFLIGSKFLETIIVYHLAYYLLIIYAALLIIKRLQKKLPSAISGFGFFLDRASDREKKLPLIFIIILGMSIRLFLASGPYNFDIRSFMSYVTAFDQGKNIYLATPFYNWSPVFFFVSGFIGFVTKAIGVLPLSFTFRAFTSFVDLVTLFVLLGIAHQKKISQVKTAALFFLNPVTIVTSGKHGHFDNFAFLFIFLALFFYYKWGQKIDRSKMIILWMLITFGLAIKHIVMFQVLAFFVNILRKRALALILFCGSVAFLLLTFVPYFFTARNEIMNQVINYSGLGGMYGVTYFIRNWCATCVSALSMSQDYKTIFMLGFFLFCFLLRKGDPARVLLLIALFFLSFTPGIGAQYFVLPIALGSLFPTKWFYLYSSITTFFYIGSIDEFAVPVFQTFSFNVVWIFVLLWFASELFHVFPSLKRYSK